MIIFELNRYKYTSDSTIGDLYITKDGKQLYNCKTLEDTVRPADIKVKGHTAIQEGVYNMVFDYSPTFSRMLLRLLNVPNFEGVRIHIGNFIEDTDGCILVGQYTKNNNVHSSALALEAIDDIIKNETEFIIKIVNLSQKE